MCEFVFICDVLDKEGHGCWTSRAHRNRGHNLPRPEGCEEVLTRQRAPTHERSVEEGTEGVRRSKVCEQVKSGRNC